MTLASESRPPTTQVPDDLRWQNDILFKELNSFQNKYSTDSARVRFINKSISYYYSLNFFLLIIYIAIGLYAMYIIFFKKPWSPTYQFICILAIALYPFIITSIEYAFRYLFTYAYSLYAGNVYLDPYYEHQPFSVTNFFSMSMLI